MNRISCAAASRTNSNCSWLEIEMTTLIYTAPRLVRHGSVEAVTKGASTGTKLDATFPAGTPFGDLTFS
jgi:hypothetical protein